MATLTSTKIKNTYDALLKATDNDAIGSSAKQITDGLGNGTPLYISTTQIGIGVTPEATYDLHVYSNAKVGGNLTVTGDLTVEGTTTTIDTQTLTVEDPLIEVASNNTSTDAVDIGWYGKYAPSGTVLYAGLFRDTGDSKFKLFRNLQEQPTTTVNTSGTGYTKADLVIGNLEATGGDFSGQVSLPDGSVSNPALNFTSDADTGISYDLALKLVFAGAEAVKITSANVDIKPNGTSVLRVDTTGVNFFQDAIFGNDIKAKFGGSGDLQIYHSATGDSYIANSTGNLIINSSGITGTAIKDEDNMASNSASHLATQQSIKAYVDTTTGNYLPLAGGTMSGSIAMGSNNISGGGTFTATTFSGQLNGTISSTTTATTQTQGDNSTKVATTAYVDSAIGGQDTLAEILANGNTTGGTDIAVSSGDDITFADSSKSIYGAGSDLEVYSDGSQGIIETPTGQYLRVNSDYMDFRDTDTVSPSTYAEFYTDEGSNSQVKLYYNSSLKFQTTSAGSQVTGDLYVTGAFKDSSNSAGTADQVLVSTGTGTDWQDLSDISGVDGTGTANYVAKWSDTDTITNSIIYDNGTNVGIGETNPDTALDVVGGNADSVVDTLTLKNDNTGNSAGAGINFVVDGANDVVTSAIYGQRTAAAYHQGSLQFLTRDASGGGLSERMRINSSGRTTINGSAGYLFDIQTTDTNQPRLQVYVDDTSGVSLISGYNTTPKPMLFYTGGSERMRITSGGYTEIKAAGGSSRLYLEGTNGTHFLTGTSGGDFGIYNDTASSYRMFINSSGNVGIGTTSIPADHRLQIHNPSAAYSRFALTNSTTGSASGDGLKFQMENLNSFILNQENGYLSFGTNGRSADLRIDSSGRVGIGADPADWAVNTGGGSLRIGSNGHIQDDSNSTYFAHNLYYNAGWKFLDSNAHYANYILMADDGTMQFANTTNTGTSGQAATVVERMRIDSSGRVGINNNNPGYKLDVTHIGADAINVNASNDFTGIRWSSDQHTYSWRVGGDNFFIYDVVNSAQRVTLDASGNLGIGTTSPSAKLEIQDSTHTTMKIRSGNNDNILFSQAIQSNDARIGTDTNTPLSFYTNTSERVRITTSGNVGIGTTLPDGKLDVVHPNSGTDETRKEIQRWLHDGQNAMSLFAYGNTADTIQLAAWGSEQNISIVTETLGSITKDTTKGIYIKSGGNVAIGNTSATYKLHVASSNNVSIFEDTSGSSNATFCAFNAPSYFAMGSITRNGSAASVLYNTGSDYRLKEDLQDFNALDLVDNITAYDYKWKNTEQRDYGFVAHELQEVMPNVVTGEKDGERMQSVDYSKLTPVLLKAIQEQQEIINDLKSRIEILENN